MCISNGSGGELLMAYKKTKETENHTTNNSGVKEELKKKRQQSLLHWENGKGKGTNIEDGDVYQILLTY